MEKMVFSRIVCEHLPCIKGEKPCYQRMLLGICKIAIRLLCKNAVLSMARPPLHAWHVFSLRVPCLCLVLLPLRSVHRPMPRTGSWFLNMPRVSPSARPPMKVVRYSTLALVAGPYIMPTILASSARAASILYSKSMEMSKTLEWILLRSKCGSIV